MSPLKVVHIVSSLTDINYGIWNAAFFGSRYLREKHNVDSLALVCDPSSPSNKQPEIPFYFLDQHDAVKSALSVLEKNQAVASNTVVVSHGCWLLPSRVASELHKKGYRWIYAPHGMLEPWSLSNGRFKKLIYWNLIERRLAKQSDVVRAVSSRERTNLQSKLRRPVTLVENGVKMPLFPTKPLGKINFVFMARLHFKKGILPLVEAWRDTMLRSEDKELIIVGPDEGQLPLIKPLLDGNISYHGALYGEEKLDLLKNSHYYILPSYSEGFPTSVVEAMSYGMIPLISDGCNFPEVFENHLGFQAEPDRQSIANVLTEVSSQAYNRDLSIKNYEYVRDHLSEERIGEGLMTMYRSLVTSI